MENTGISTPSSARPSILGPVLVGGFVTALVVWIGWFITHLPWLGLSEQASKLSLLSAWLVAAVFTARAATRAGYSAILSGGLIGLTSAVLGLLILGSKLAAPADASGKAGNLIPNAGLIAVGFLLLGSAIGLLAGAAAKVLTKASSIDPAPRDWLARFGWVAVVATTPLLFAGGLVTSTQSGMAVPDWPSTYGSNMFLYPLGSMTTPTGVYLEHAHRLFGALIGLTSIVLMVWTLRSDRRGWLKAWVVVTFIFICSQGLLGGQRVNLNKTTLALLHGISAQLIFASLAAIAVFLSPTYRDAQPGTLPNNARRLKLFAALAMHSSLLQLVFGAMYRHMRSPHALWSHIGFSLVVVAGASMAGMIASGLPADRPIVRVLRKVGIGLFAVVIVQFLLGWMTFSLGGKTLEAPGIPQALLRTSHQANGALLIGFATAAAMYSRRLFKTSTISA